MLRFNAKTRAVLIAVLLCFACNSFAHQTSPIGKWTGSLRTDTYGTMRIDADFKDKLAALHFVGNSSCRVDASYIDTDAEGSHYTFKLSTNGGGFCDKLFNGKLIATPAGSDVKLSIQQHGDHWVTTLKPDSP
jgi:hypothetical protein